tara:strand:- start:247 stop:1101 length:855 start_codon:yes stop_codon:yes gene_type:complete
VGLGLIGGSIAKALKENAPAATLIGYDSDQEALELALAEQVVDRTGDLKECLESADIVILALPPLLIAEIIPKLPALIKERAVITDVASVKNIISDSVKETPKAFQARFVLGHPIAGSERRGYSASTKALFYNRKVILSTVDSNLESSISAVRELWQLVGAEVLELDLKSHDKILAATSHLPHILAYALVEALAEQKEADDIFLYAAGGFADFSRLASSDPGMWSEIFASNATETSKALDFFIKKLIELKKLVKAENRHELLFRFKAAKAARDSFIQKHYKNND